MRGESPGVSSRPHTHTQDNSTKTGPSSTSAVVPNMPSREFQNETDPLRRMHDALDQAGCKPTGPVHKFRAYCPAHGGENPEALAVTEGVDGRAVMYCFRGCEAQAVLDALGLRWTDTFPPGHRNAAKLKPRPVKSLSAGAAFLDAMTGGGYRWHAQLLGVECPYCSDPNAYLTVHDRGGLDVNCPNDCGAQEVRRAVETRAAIAEKGLQL
jgi:hypothetical protein